MNIELQNRITENRILIGTSSFWGMTPEGNEIPMFNYANEHVEPLATGKEIVIISHATSSLNDTSDATEAHYRKLGAKNVYALHRYPGQELEVLENADLTHIGGGNYYRLAANLYALRNADSTLVDRRSEAIQNPIAEFLRNRSAEGLPIVGVSAGLLAMAVDGRGADDPTGDVQIMPDGSRVIPVRGLELLPSHLLVMPHLKDRAIPGIIKYTLSTSPEMKLIGVNDKSYIYINGDKMSIHGETESVIFEKGKTEITETPIQPKTDISYLLTSQE